MNRMKIIDRNRSIKFGKIPLPVIADPVISHAAKTLYAYFKSRCFNGEHPDECYPSQKTVAENLGTDIRSVQRWLKELVDRELVCIDKEKTTNTYILNDLHVVYGDAATASWSTMPKFKANGKVDSIDDKSVVNPNSLTTNLSPTTRQICRVPSTILKIEEGEEEEDAPSEQQQQHSISNSQNKTNTQPVDVKKEVSIMDAKMLFAQGHKQEPKKKVDKPKNKTTTDHLGVSKEIRDCNELYAKHLRSHGFGSGVFTKKKVEAWDIFLQGQNKPSDALAIIEYVLSHWKDLKRRFGLRDAFPSVFFFQTGYIDTIGIEVLSKSSASKPASDYSSWEKLAKQSPMSKKYGGTDD